MSWEDQGRQEHGRFGTGTSGNEAAVAERAVDIVAAVGQAAVATLGGSSGRQFGVMLEEGGLADLRDALPVWASAAGMGAAAFRAAVVGPAFSAAGAAALREAGLVLLEGGAASVDAAGVKLAVAFAGVAGEDQGYALNYAADMARYAEANGLGSSSEPQKSDEPATVAMPRPQPSRDCFSECAHLLRSPSGDLQNSEFRKCYRECVGSLGG